MFTENSRVKIPAIIQLTRLGYDYLSLRDPSVHSQIDPNTNIFHDIFTNSLVKINSTNTPPHNVDLVSQIQRLYDDLKSTELDSEDLGESFYNALLHGKDGLKLIDFENFNRNTFNVVTELPYTSQNDEFRPDITILVNGMPLAFIEVKKPNNNGGIAVERARINERLHNRKFRRFINLTQLMIFSNNMEHDDETVNSLQGAFYATTAYGDNAKVKFNHFREQLPSEIVDQIQPINQQVERGILFDNNCQVIKDSDEYQTNKDPNSPTNRLITSLLCKPRLEFILKYSFAFVHSNGDIQRHIMRYPQFFATKAIARTLDQGIKKGVIWHTQGSGKTALAYHNVKFLTDYFAKQNKVAKFYFIVDRLDLLTQAAQEFTKRGLAVRTVNSKDELAEEFCSSNVSHSGENEICVINIQKFRDDTQAGNTSGYDDINIQRIYFIDEAHRSYDPRGSYLANLYQSDNDSIKIALTGTPLIVYNNHQAGDEYDERLSNALDRKTTVSIFGNYIHKYYYTDSIRDGYTLRLLREDIETTYKRDLRNLRSQLSVQEGELRKKDLYAHEKYVTPLLSYIAEDFCRSRQLMGDDSIGGMIVSHSSEQARELYRQATDRYPNLRVALILHNEGDKTSRKQLIDDFKSGHIDLLIVYSMLLTGFDAPRLKKLYLCRVIRAHNLLQTLTRVNRPYKDFHMGYVVDFADISDEFEQTNEHYLAELKNEYQNGIDDSDGNVFTSLFVSRDELEQHINQIQENLKNYNTANAEIFSQQISQMHDKRELIRLSKSLGEARSLYNIIRLLWHNDLLNKLDFTRLNAEYQEVLNRLQLVRAQNALDSTDIDRQQLLNIAIEDVIFDFHKVGEEELRLQESVNTANQLTRDIRHQMDANYDHDDAEFVDLYDEFASLLRKSRIEQLNQDEIDTVIRHLGRIYEQMVSLNRRNKQLADQYRGDVKYAIVDKSMADTVREATPRYNYLIDVKNKEDRRIQDNENIVENDQYFRTAVRGDLHEAVKAGGLDIDRETRIRTADKLTDLYIKQYKGED